MKRCTKCRKVKSLEEFYEHGGASQCKACVKAAVKVRRDADLEGHRARDRKRYYEQEKRRQQARRAYENASAEKKRFYKRKWALDNMVARDCHVKIGNAVSQGRLSKPDQCSRCGESTPSRRLHAHHEDYSKPLEIEWICSKCHGMEHRKGA